MVLNRVVYGTLITRGSRYFAEARYLKCRVSDKIIVANEVEIEQIVYWASTTGLYGPYCSPHMVKRSRVRANGSSISPTYTSYVQVRND